VAEFEYTLLVCRVAPEYLLMEPKQAARKKPQRREHNQALYPTNFRSTGTGLDGAGDVRVF
jgi:hypothetical protein